MPRNPHPSGPNAYRSRNIILERRDRRYEEAAARRQNFLKLHRFVLETIGPWATQARISQMIAEDFDEMALDRSVKDAVKVSFGMYNTHQNSPQVGHARFVQIAPSRAHPTRRSSHNDIIHRGLTEQEFFQGAPVVRLYVTVFSEAKSIGGRTEYKDIHQDLHTKRIIIHTGTQVNPILWLNAGQPLRALKWFEKYKVENKSARPLIRSFCLPVNKYLEITKNVILEHEASNPKNENRSFNVDRHYASDQFGIRGNELKILSEHAVPASLVTYADESRFATAQISGDIQSTRALRERLGVPKEDIPGANVWVDPARGEFVKKGKFTGLADKLMNIYGTWIGNDLFITDTWQTIPRTRRLQMMRDALSEYQLHIPEEFWQLSMGGRSLDSIARSLPR